VLTFDMSHRLRFAAIASLWHLAISAVVAAAAAALVFGLWFPHPYREISGGRDLFLLLLGVDLALGPLITLMAYAPEKPRAVWVRDLAVIVSLQLAALAYGLYAVSEARPVRLVAEGNRFRVVSKAELAGAPMHQAPAALQSLGWAGPKLIGARLAQPTDADYTESIRVSMEGLHPALRPGRWVPYDEVKAAVLQEAKPVVILLEKHPAKAQLLSEAAPSVPASSLVYLPLVSRTKDNWVVLLDARSGRPSGYAPVDGW
jgi:hypothetical protein